MALNLNGGVSINYTMSKDDQDMKIMNVVSWTELNINFNYSRWDEVCIISQQSKLCQLCEYN